MIISVIVPLYYGEKYIENILDMLERNQQSLQSLAELELILVKDSQETFQGEYTAGRQIAVRLVCNQKNMGIQYSRVEGLKRAGGEYVHFLDQDDQITDDFYLSQIKGRKDGDVIVANGIKEYNGYDKLLYRYGFMQQTVRRLWFYEVFSCRILSPGQCLIRRSCIPKEWEQNILINSGADDFFLWILLFQKGCKFTINRKPVYRHIYTGENVSLDDDRMNRSLLEMVERLEGMEMVRHITAWRIRTYQLKQSSGMKRNLIKIIENINRLHK